MAKKSPKRSSKKVLAFDLGGTKIAAAVINERGRILEETRMPVDFSQGVNSLVGQFVRMGLPLIKKYKIKKAAVASAGPLNPITGELLNPTNLKTKGKAWGVVPLAKLLRRSLKIDVKIENDAACAVLAEHWIGRGRKTKDLIAVTLGTGLGVGVMIDGHLLRSGRYLHTEAGHIQIDYKDTRFLCGCGNYGCAEASLSGANLTRVLSQEWELLSLTGEELVRLARGGDARATKEFKMYGERLASFIYSLIVVFSPVKIVLSGGFSHAQNLYFENFLKKLKQLLRTRREGVDMLPLIEISSFSDDACLLGASYLCLNNNA